MAEEPTVQETLNGALQDAYDRGLRDGQESARREIQFALDSIKRTAAADFELPVTVLELNERPYFCLNRAQIINLGELVSKTEDDLLEITNLGHKSLDEIKQRLAERGLKLREA